nr:hypothetical protein [Bradyrhizobium shewense]
MAAAEASASILHLHARDPKDGRLVTSRCEGIETSPSACLPLETRK